MSYYGSSDHSHYGYADASHSHRGEYADEGHDHYLDYAERHHGHDYADRDHDHQDLLEQIHELGERLDAAVARIRDLEGQTPQARQLQLEADLAAADLVESGYDRHGRDCQCSYCATDEDEAQDDPDEPSNRELEPEPPGWYDVPSPEEDR